MLGRSLKTLSDVVDWGLCVGCGACAFACKRGAVRMVHVESEGFRPIFEDPSCAECTECVGICPSYRVDGRQDIVTRSSQFGAEREFGSTLEIWEGWASDPEIRFRASSGGLLSALSLYCLEQAGFAGVIHAGMDSAEPWMNTNYISRDRKGILARTGSRYAPSAPCAALRTLNESEGVYVFIGKPCDTAAVSELREQDPSVRNKVGLVLTFFCAGTPSTRGTLDLMQSLDVEPATVEQVHYRGEGWPGEFRIVRTGCSERKVLSYNQSWGRLTAYRPLRCNLCPDGLGRVADLSCGDAWERHGADGDPGRSIVLVRTERGREILEGARRAGYVSLERVDAQSVLRAQPNLLERRRSLFGRMMAFRMVGVPMPDYVGFCLFRSWLALGPKAQLKSVLGTLRRIIRHGWFRRRRNGWSDAGPQAADRK